MYTPGHGYYFTGSHESAATRSTRPHDPVDLRAARGTVCCRVLFFPLPYATRGNFRPSAGPSPTGTDASLPKLCFHRTRAALGLECRAWPGRQGRSASAARRLPGWRAQAAGVAGPGDSAGQGGGCVRAGGEAQGLGLCGAPPRLRDGEERRDQGVRLQGHALPSPQDRRRGHERVGR